MGERYSKIRATGKGHSDKTLTLAHIKPFGPTFGRVTLLLFRNSHLRGGSITRVAYPSIFF